MAWELSSWLVLTRSFQLVGALTAGCMNGFLIAWIYMKELGLMNNMIVLEILISIVLVYTTVALLVQHTGTRSKRSSWLTCFIVCDVMFIGMAIGIITVLARAGVPSNCVGLTQSDFSFGDGRERPGYGYTTTRFSDEAGGHKGELDKYCAFERSFYFVAIGLVFTYMVTIILAVLRICESSYTKNTRVNDLLASLERANEKEQQSPLLLTTPSFMPPPPSEGIVTRQTSMRSVATTRHGVGPYHAAPIIPRRPVPNRTSAFSAIPSPINEVPETRNTSQVEEYDPLVADGMRHQSPRQQEQRDYYATNRAEPQQQTVQRQMPMLREVSDGSSVAEADMVADGMQYRPSNLGSGYRPERQETSTPVPIDEESAALVSDGMRPLPNLPPYTPGGSRMSMQASQWSAMRLAHASRPRDMKDSGDFKQ